MGKIKLGVIFGGTSTEHDVSVVSGKSVLKHLNKNKYEIFPIYISKDGEWFKYNETNKNSKIDNICEYLKNIDVVFPVLHGLGGEDGTIQGLLELLKIPYVGSKVLGSSICMDKVYTKTIFEKADINQAEYIYVKKYGDNFVYVEKDFSEEIFDIYELIQKITEKLEFPMFIKPSNSGSSVGINKVNNIDELKNAIEYAGLFDKKILVEEGINGREVECAVLGNEEPKASVLGEIIPGDSFYSYDAKYNNKESKTIVPADISETLSNKVRNLAIKAYKATDCKGFARVDFFVNTDTEEIYINEINTIPGFTEISMFPKLWEATGISYEQLLDRLIDLALN